MVESFVKIKTGGDLDLVNSTKKFVWWKYISVEELGLTCYVQINGGAAFLLPKYKVGWNTQIYSYFGEAVCKNFLFVSKLIF